MARHLVTGAAGFLGAQIIERLAQIEQQEIFGLDILDCDTSFKNVTHIRGSVLDKDLLMEITKGVDYVHHNAALVPLTKSGKGFYTVNVIGTRNIVESCKKNSIRRLTHMSSSAIYGLPQDMPITDKTVYSPIEVYGQSKLDGEKEVWRYMKEGGSASCIRPRTIVGGKSRLGIFQILFEWISEGRNIYAIGSGNNLFQLVHVDDLIDASIKATFSEYNGIYNIGAAIYGTIRQDLLALCTYAKTGSKVKSLPVGLAKCGLYLMDKLRFSPLAPWHYLTYHKPFVFDISKAQQELHWFPRYSNIESLIESYEWYLENRNKMTDSKSTHKKPVQQRILKIIKYFS